MANEKNRYFRMLFIAKSNAKNKSEENEVEMHFLEDIIWVGHNSHMQPQNTGISIAFENIKTTGIRSLPAVEYSSCV